MSTAVSSAAMNGSKRKPSENTAAVPTSTGTTAAGRVGGRAAIIHTRSAPERAGETFVAIQISQNKEQRTKNKLQLLALCSLSFVLCSCYGNRRKRRKFGLRFSM